MIHGDFPKITFKIFPRKFRPESLRSNQVRPFRCIISTCQLQVTRSCRQLLIYIVKPRGAVRCGVALQLAPNGAPPSAASLVSVRAHPIIPLSPLLFLRRRESPPNTLPCPLARTPRHQPLSHPRFVGFKKYHTYSQIVGSFHVKHVFQKRA